MHSQQSSEGVEDGALVYMMVAAPNLEAAFEAGFVSFEDDNNNGDMAMTVPKSRSQQVELGEHDNGDDLPLFVSADAKIAGMYSFIHYLVG